MDDLELHQQITKLAQEFRLFECIQCAEAIKRFLIRQGISGQHIKLFTGSVEDPFSNIYDEVLKQNISTNGRHEAIAVTINNEELIFDNIHPEGISRQDWLNNLYSPINDMGKDFQITEVDF
ncbi:papain fold toxin domain-containing protein [Leptolyngbyaceae cyanobacterium UHCC 1019]